MPPRENKATLPHRGFARVYQGLQKNHGLLGTFTPKDSQSPQKILEQNSIGFMGIKPATYALMLHFSRGIVLMNVLIVLIRHTIRQNSSKRDTKAESSARASKTLTKWTQRQT
jgi:hypothetical protein